MMDEFVLERVTTRLRELDRFVPIGRVGGISGSQISVSGLPAHARLGDRVAFDLFGKKQSGEIIRLEKGDAAVMTEGSVEGLSIGTPVKLIRPPTIAPHEGWIGRVVDPDGVPLDGRPLLPGVKPQSLQGEVLPATQRRPMGDRVETGIAVFNTILPIARGQRLGLFAGSGVGKSTLLANLAKGIEADVIVIGLVGERGREVRDFTQTVLGREGMKRSVVVAATSDRAPNVRRRCAWTATAVAEYFRDQGLQVLLLCDSVTRFCEAHREVAAASGEAANLRGFPASLNGTVAKLCERTGPGVGEAGDITAIYTVLVAGSDMEEPIADILRGILDGHVVLSRSIAERGRFPAVDVLRSVSRCLPEAADQTENALILTARRRLSAYEGAETMIRAGLYEQGSDPEIDAAQRCYDVLDNFLSVADGRQIRSHFASLKQTLDHATASA